ncbi:hypothetical protein ACQP2U_04005 [Nocardia sp. CA-084685]|uniref:hypothetical protein n=1 Tax=Nocardia sp. CA-084685 TaxID=3239970 RepID=UPI003D979561
MGQVRMRPRDIGGGHSRDQASASVAAEARGDRTPADWQPFVSDEIIDRPIGSTHELMTSAEALAEIGPRLAELLEPPERRRSAG